MRHAGAQLARRGARARVRLRHRAAAVRAAGREPRRRGRSAAALGPAAFAGRLFREAELTAAPAGQEVGFAMLHSLYWLAVNIGARRPTLIMIDDLHWVDAATLRWLCYLLPRLEGVPFALLVASRPSRMGREPALLEQILGDPNAVLRPGPLHNHIRRVDGLRRVLRGAGGRVRRRPPRGNRWQSALPPRADRGSERRGVRSLRERDRPRPAHRRPAGSLPGDRAPPGPPAGLRALGRRSCRDPGRRREFDAVASLASLDPRRWRRRRPHSRSPT